MIKMFALYQRYAFIVVTVIVYLSLKAWLGLGDDVAVLVSNVFGLAFFQVFDFAAGLPLVRLRTEQLQASCGVVPVCLSSSAIVTPNQTVKVANGNELILNLSPGLF